MKRFLPIFLLLLCFALPASAQFTIATGTVTDVNGLPYDCGTISAVLVVPGGASPTLNGLGFTGSMSPVGLGCSQQAGSGASGSFIARLADNNVVLPSGTQWKFQVNTPGVPPPLGTGPQTCIATVTITGSTQSISSSFSACPALSKGLISSVQGVPGPVFNVLDPKYNTSNKAGKVKYSKNCVTTANSYNVSNTTDSPWTQADIGSMFFSMYGPVGAQAIASTIITVTDSAHIVLFNNGTVRGDIGTLTSECAWYPSPAVNGAQFVSTYDTLAAQAAHAAAFSSTQAGEVSVNSPTFNYQATLFFPPGGYALNATILNEQPAATGNTGVSVKCDHAQLYIIPDFTQASSGVGLFFWFNSSNFELSGCKFYGFSQNFASQFAGSAALIGLNQSGNFKIENNIFRNWASNGSYNTGADVLSIINPFGNFKVERNRFDGGAVGATSGLIYVIGAGGQGQALDTNFASNGYVNHYISAGGRNTQAGSFTIKDEFGDECGIPGGLACHQFVGSDANIRGGTFFGSSGQPSMSIDATSIVRIHGSNVGAFTTSGNACAVNFTGAGGTLITEDTTLRGNGTSAAVCGPSTATWIDKGTDIQNCLNTTCNPVTAAQQATSSLGWSGGINPRASLTHTPNTCYAASGTLVQSQNVCTFLNDQNYQVVNITAQSGGAAPANSSCAAAPVVTLSDGTRTATLTLTTGKTSWSSAVDVSTVNSIFAKGTTLTISVGTFTCATPPANLSISYTLQSVLNL